MAQTSDSAWHFSPICDRRSGRDLFAMAMSNPAILACSLIERDHGREYELAAYAHAGIAAGDSRWREPLAEAEALHERRRDERLAARDYSHLGEHVGASDVCMDCRDALADFGTGWQLCKPCKAARDVPSRAEQAAGRTIGSGPAFLN